MRGRNRYAFSLIELLTVIGIAAIMLGLTIAAVQRVRQRAAASRCLNNVKQLALALHSYHDMRKSFPAGCSGSQTRQPYMSWLTRLLPQIEEPALWEQSLDAFAKAEFFEDPSHRPILGHPITAFICPLETRTHIETRSLRIAFASYLGVSGRSMSVFDGVLYLDSATRLNDVLDGTSCTIAIGERPPSRDGRFGWWYAGWGIQKSGTADLFLGVRERATEYRSCLFEPSHFVPGSDDDCDTFHFWSRHPGGAHFAFCDGSVRFLAYSADPIMPALATRAGGEAVALPE